MYFSLKKNANNKDTLIILRYYVSKKEGRFVCSTGLNISSGDWDYVSKMAKNLRGRSDLSSINRVLQKYATFLEKILLQFEFDNVKVNKELLKQKFKEEFRSSEVNSGTLIYFTDYSLRFMEKAPGIVNRTTNKNFTKESIRDYGKAHNRLIEYEKYSKSRIRIDSFTIAVYDNLVDYLITEQSYAINTVGSTIKRIKRLLKLAVKDGYKVSPDFLEENFTPIKEDVVAIALSENEIDEICKFDFSYSDRLQNCRDLAILGLWTGLRVSDFLTLDDIDVNNDFITIQPKKTKTTSGIKVVIPLHHNIKEMVTKRGMPRMISSVKFNIYFKEVCCKVGLNELVEGSLMHRDEKKRYRKKVGFYPKYKIVSSHTCRRSFATNLYKMNIPSLSIMAITGHTTEKSFLTYIKVTPTEHAEKLLHHWKEYYKK